MKIDIGLKTVNAVGISLNGFLSEICCSLLALFIRASPAGERLIPF